MISLGSSSPARPWRRASTQAPCQRARMSSALAAPQDSDTHWVRYCSWTRRGVGSPLAFSKVIPAAMNPVEGTVSP